MITKNNLIMNKQTKKHVNQQKLHDRLVLAHKIKKRKPSVKSKISQNKQKLLSYEIKYIERVIQRLVPFYQLDANKALAIKNLTTKDFDDLTPLTRRTYYLDFQRKIKSKNRKLIKKYSKKNLKSEIIVSSDPNKTKTISKSLDLEKFVIQAKEISKSYFSTSVETKILQKLDINIKKNTFLCILGPSGSGKTTLLNLLSGLDKATEGDIFIKGINLSVLNDRDLTYFRKENIGFVFQQYNLLSNLNVSENIELGAALAKKKDRKYIDNLLKTIDLKKHIKKYPYQLSGGEQQRVSIARALAKKPEILFCDEPTGALDQITGKIVLKILHKINAETKTTVILVTHNRHIAQISDVIMELKEGKVHSITKNKQKKDIQELNW